MSEKIRLGTLTRIRTGKLDANASSENGRYPFFTCSKEVLHIDSYSYDCECVLVAGNGDLNVKYYNGKFDAYQRTYIIESVDKTKLLPKYLFYFLEIYVEALREQAIGGVIKYIKLGNLTEAKIPLVSIENQYKIVAFLDKYVEVVGQRKEQLKKHDNLIKSQFIEMFGSMPLETTLSYYISELRAGKSVAGVNPCINKVLKTGAATFGYFDESQVKNLPIDYIPNPLHLVESGDVIISRMNTPELVGTCSYVWKAPKNTYYPDRLWKTVVKQGVSAIFLWQLMQQPSVRKQIKENASGTSGSMWNISKPNLLRIAVAKVSPQAQTEFAHFVEQTDKSKFRIKQSLEKLEICYKSLLQKYFG